MLRVSKTRPCPICRKPDWCGVSEDGALAVCMRIESAVGAANGGWVHVLKDRPPEKRTRMPVAPRKAVDPSIGTRWAEWRRRTPAGLVERHADELVVSAAALNDIGAAWSSVHRAWAYPMRNAHGAVVGIRLRDPATARKWAVTGSLDGIFAPSHPGNVRELIICEGPTDTAAALSVGFQAIGRPSCMGTSAIVQEYVKARRVREVVIIADNDPPKRRPNGTYGRPGLEGAQKLAQSIGVPTRVIVPAGKDLRAWVASGASIEAIQSVINQSPVIGGIHA